MEGQTQARPQIPSLSAPDFLQQDLHDLFLNEFQSYSFVGTILGILRTFITGWTFTVKMGNRHQLLLEYRTTLPWASPRLTIQNQPPPNPACQSRYVWKRRIQPTGYSEYIFRSMAWVFPTASFFALGMISMFRSQNQQVDPFPGKIWTSILATIHELWPNQRRTKIKTKQLYFPSGNA